MTVEYIIGAAVVVLLIAMYFKHREKPVDMTHKSLHASNEVTKAAPATKKAPAKKTTKKKPAAKTTAAKTTKKVATKKTTAAKTTKKVAAKKVEK